MEGCRWVGANLPEASRGLFGELPQFAQVSICVSGMIHRTPSALVHRPNASPLAEPRPVGPLCPGERRDIQHLLRARRRRAYPACHPSRQYAHSYGGPVRLIGAVVAKENRLDDFGQ